MRTITFESNNTISMKISLQCAALLATLFMSYHGWSQVDPIAEPPAAPGDTIDYENLIFDFVEQPADYQGGMDSLKAFISHSMRYPKEAVESELGGTVYVGFVVEKDGSTSNIHIKRGISGAPMLDKEALRVVRTIRFKTPAYQKGQPVRSSVILPIRFHLR